MSARSRVPVVVLSGGLGSGKTTLLNHLLRGARGRIGVVVNDFGDVNVDAFLVQGHVDATATITGGCLCCLSDPSELDGTLAALARPSLDLDAIVVEASGLAEPRELARMVLASGVRGVRFGGVVEVLDAAAAAPDEHPDGLPVAADHLRVASLLVLNKADRVAAEELERVEAAVRTRAPHTPLVRTSFGALDPTLLFDVAEREEPTGQLSFTDLLAEDDYGHEGHAHERYASVSVDSPLPVDPRRLVAFLEERPPGVSRVKGTVHVGVPGRREQYVVQAVGGWLGFERRPWPEGHERRSRLVAIGTQVETEALRSALEACLTEEDVPADRLHAMTRYTR